MNALLLRVVRMRLLNRGSLVQDWARRLKSRRGRVNLKAKASLRASLKTNDSKVPNDCITLIFSLNGLSI